MFENFNTGDFIILAILCIMNLLCIGFIIFLAFKRKKSSSVIDSPEEIKVVKIEEDKNISAFDEIMEAMQKDIESKKEDAVEIFEQEQEEKAIISYQELLNINKKEEIKEEQKENKKTIPKLVTTTESKFTNSEFVSPVFGKLDKNKTNIEIVEQLDTHQLEKTLNIEPLTEEIKKNNEFLNALKDFRKNL